MYSKKMMKSAIESMMFVWGQPLSVKDASAVLEASRSETRTLFEELKAEYDADERGIRIRRVDDSYQFVTYAENELFIEKLATPVKVKRLSQAALEVLAIVAYGQPVTRSEIDSIRGIKSDRVVEGLLAKGLITECGRSDGIGRPFLYGTTDEFLKKFGFADLKDLPDVENFDDLGFGKMDEGGSNQQIAIDFDVKPDGEQDAN